MGIYKHIHFNGPHKRKAMTNEELTIEVQQLAAIIDLLGQRLSDLDGKDITMKANCDSNEFHIVQKKLPKLKQLKGPTLLADEEYKKLKDPKGEIVLEDISRAPRKGLELETKAHDSCVECGCLAHVLKYGRCQFCLSHPKNEYIFSCSCCGIILNGTAKKHSGYCDSCETTRTT